MTLNKKILAAAIVGGLCAVNAQAQVNLSAAANASTNPALYAAEIIASTTTPVQLLGSTYTFNTAPTLVNGGANVLQAETGYAFSAGEVRYARFECSSNLRFRATNTTAGLFANGDAIAAVSTLAGVSSGTIGNVNGLGTSVITFSITAPAGGIPNNALVRVFGDRTLTGAGAANCEYSLYDQPSQAAAGGTSGRITTSGSRPAISFANSLALRVVAQDRIADVEADPSFSLFTTGDAAEHLGQVYFGLRNTVSTALADSPVLAQPALADGTLPATPAVFVGATANHVVTGDFTLAANADGTYPAAARARVYFNATADCAKGAPGSFVDATALTATSATFTIGSTAVNGLYFCVATRAGNTIAASDYSQQFNAVSVAPTTYSVSNIGPVDLGSITRNGTSLQAQFAQVPSGWISRIVLTNTGSVARPYTIAAQTETGTTATLGSAATGTVPANGTIVLNTADIVTFTGNPRGTLNVTVSGPDEQIQGLYQIVNGQTGSIANTALVRPGTN